MSAYFPPPDFHFDLRTEDASSLRRKAREWGVAYEGTEEEEEPPPPPTPPGPERNGQRGGRETAARCRLAQLMSERDVAGRAARHVDKRKQKHRVAGVKTLQNWQKGLWANGIVIK